MYERRQWEIPKSGGTPASGRVRTTAVHSKERNIANHAAEVLGLFWDIA